MAKRAPVALIGLLVVVAGSFIAPSPVAAEEEGRSVTTRWVGPGVKLKRITNARKHWDIRVLIVDMTKASTIDTGLATDELDGSETVSSIASRHGAIAAVNGDFSLSGGRPLYTYAEDGRLLQTEQSWGRAFAVDAAETRAYIGHPSTFVAVTPDGGEAFRVEKMNSGRPGKREVAAFTREGKGVSDPPAQACSARLVRRTRPKLNDDGQVVQRFRVGYARCRKEAMSPGEGVVIAARRFGPRRADVGDLKRDDMVTLRWSLGWAGVMDGIGGNPVMIEKGRTLWDEFRDCGYLCERHPRTGVGYSGSKVFFATVDGRQSDSWGMTMKEFARLFRSLGARYALNLDGGGATTMWVKGKVVNDPSDGRERGVANALLVLPGGDPGEAPPSKTSSSFGPSALSTSVDAALTDPASTGGMLDHLERNGAKLDRDLQRMVGTFRSSQR